MSSQYIKTHYRRMHRETENAQSLRGGRLYPFIHSLRVSPGTQTDVTVNITQVMEAHCQNIKRRNLERTGNIFDLQLSISFPELTRLKWKNPPGNWAQELRQQGEYTPHFSQMKENAPRWWQTKWMPHKSYSQSASQLFPMQCILPPSMV